MSSPSQIKVWDPLVRFFHWSLVSAFVIAYVTEEDLLSLHSWAGYLILILLCVRIVWGFIGTQHARFSDFVFGKHTIMQFLKDTLQHRAKRYLGHNPAGGAMIILMLTSLLITCVSGVVLLGADEQTGPLASLFTQQSTWVDAMEESHEFFANFTVLLVFIHLAGVFIESRIHKENLVSAMITGMKENRE